MSRAVHVSTVRMTPGFLTCSATEFNRVLIGNCTFSAHYIYIYIVQFTVLCYSTFRSHNPVFQRHQIKCSAQSTVYPLQPVTPTVSVSLPYCLVQESSVFCGRLLAASQVLWVIAECEAVDGVLRDGMCCTVLGFVSNRR